MDKELVLKNICSQGLVAIVRTDTCKEAVFAAERIAEAGVKAIEISLTVPDGIQAIEQLSKHFEGSEVLIGAGTVLNPETARRAVDAGAKYIISPCLNTKTVEFCVNYKIACMPGAMTVKEVVESMEAGADIIKVFPAELFGPAIIKAIKGPLPNARLMPTGGVTPENVGEWINAGSLAVGVGNSLTSFVRKKDFEGLKTAVNKYLGEISKARNKIIE